MATDLPDIEIIDRYLNGELAEQERLKFESEMEENTALQSAVEEHLKSLALAKELGKAQWREEMSDRFLEDPPVVRGLSRRMIFTLAASILALLIIGGLWFLQTNRSLSPEQWVAANVEIPSAPEIKSTVQDEQLSEAYLAYNQADYGEALKRMSAIESDVEGSKQIELYFFKGMSLFYMNRYSEARENLEKIDQGAYKEMAAWYGTLSYIQEGKPALAKERLQEIANQPGFYQDKAKELLDTL